MIDDFHGGNFFLSNFSPHQVWFEGQHYPTAEHAYQAAKTVNPDARARIQACVTPGGAKRLGQQLTQREGWNEYHRHVAMERVLASKFARRNTIELLLATGDALLVEGNTWHDNVWGDCRCGVLPGCVRPGVNLLGYNLMRLRTQRRCERGASTASEPEGY